LSSSLSSSLSPPSALAFASSSSSSSSALASSSTSSSTSTPTSTSHLKSSRRLRKLLSEEDAMILLNTEPTKNGGFIETQYRKPISTTVSSLIQMAKYCPNLQSLCLGSTQLIQDTQILETGD